MSGRCFIIGAGDFCGNMPRPREGDMIIAADAGYESALSAGMMPDWIIGDFDSLGRVPEENNVIVLPVAKDDTDMLYAVKTGLEHGADEFLLLGGTGGRLDHTFANVQTLAYLRRHSARGFLLGRGFTVTVIENECIHFDGYTGRVSVFCTGSEAKGVYLRGMVFPLTDAALTNDMPLGVSNRFNAATAEIEVSKGMLTVYWEGNEGRELPSVK